MKPGRPTKYRKTFPAIAGALWAKGATDEQVAKRLKIDRDTLKEFVKKHPEFSATKAACKEIADDNVERALYDRAIGSVLPDCHVSVWDGAVTVTPLLKHYPPDVAACSLWLRNRRPKDWREKTELAVDQEVAGVPKEFLDSFRRRFLQSVASNKGNGH